MVKEYKATKARVFTTLFLSKEKKVSHSSLSIDIGRKWRPQEAIKEAKTYWKHQEIVGVPRKTWPQAFQK